MDSVSESVPDTAVDFISGSVLDAAFSDAVSEDGTICGLTVSKTFGILEVPRSEAVSGADCVPDPASSPRMMESERRERRSLEVEGKR